MGLFDLLRALVFVSYLVASLLMAGAVLAKRDGLSRAGAVCAAAGFALHTLTLMVAMAGQAGFLTSSAFYVSLISWVLVASYFLAWWRWRLGFLALTAAPLALLMFTASLALPGMQILLPKAASAWFWGLHIATLYLAMGLLAVAFGVGIAFLVLNAKIKHKARLSSLERDMPSLATFDRINFWAVLAGFPLYTLGLLSGFIWSGLTRGHVFTGHPREITALLTWFLFAFLFHQRLAIGWRGRKPATLAIWVFVITVISMLAVHLFGGPHHSMIAPLPGAAS